MPPLRTGKPEPEKMLVSWKEIASFLDRAERTAKRWERARGLPVHRVPSGERGGVYAYPSELEEWLRGKKGELEEGDSAPDGTHIGQHVDSAEAGQAALRGAAPASSIASHRRTPTLARIAAWLIPLALTAAFILYLSASHTDPRARTIGERSTSDIKAPKLAPEAIAVLPFANRGGDSGSNYLADGITDSLIGSLAHIPQLMVRSRDSVFRLREDNIDVQKAGSKLGVSKVVSGRIFIRARRIQITAELTDVRDNSEIWEKQYAGSTSNLLELQGQIDGDIARELRSDLTPADTQMVTRQGTQSVQAYNLYLKGRYAWYQRDLANLKASISYFNQAVVKDPGFALAYSGLADAYSVMPNFDGNPNEDFPKSNAAARKALELDSTLAHPHAVLGANEMEYDWDFAGGEAEFKQAFALDTNDATAHQWFAERISQLGRHQEALAEINRAHELDPLSPVITRVIAGIWADAGQFDQAIDTCKRLVRESPSFPMAHDCLVYAYWGKHMYAQAVQEWIIESHLNGTPYEIEFSNALERGYRTAGWKGAMTGAAAALEARRQKGYASPFIIARFYADAGDKGKAFHWLEIAYHEHDGLLLNLEVSPGFDNLRSDSRFSELAREVGLPELHD